jgi:hypothetical protein
MDNELDIDLFATSVFKIISDYFDITLYRPTGSHIVFIANPILRRRGWKREMNRRLAMNRARARIERDKENYRITVIPLTPSVGRPSLLNIVFFLLTFMTVLTAAAYREVGDALASNPSLLTKGIPFTATLMTILLVHELGHFWAGLRRGVIMSYPLFIPAPTFLGTFGAVIRTRSPISNRNDLILIGASGPLAGAIPAIIALIIGYAASEVVYRTGPPMFTFGNSLLTLLMHQIFFGEIPSGMTIDFSPIALAGKVGLLVTMLNLLPLGQLDGGHITYGLLQKGQHRLAIVFMLCLVGLGFFWAGWWIWLVLAAVMRPFHPPVIDSSLIPDGTHKKIGWTAVFLFVITFVPMPIY